MSCLDLEDAECQRIAEPMLDDVMLGLSRCDFALYTRHFSVALKSTTSAEAFVADCERQRESLGQAGPRVLVCVFRKRRSFTLIWHQPFDREQGETLLMATIALKGGRYFIDFFLLH